MAGSRTAIYIPYGSPDWEAFVLPLSYARSLFLTVLVNCPSVQLFDRFIGFDAKSLFEI
jgi:hypothetical protein